MTDADRQRLVAILGMLGSAAAGERDNAARLAEKFRCQHGMTWGQLFEPQTVYVYIDRPTPPQPPPPAPEPPPPAAPKRSGWTASTIVRTLRDAAAIIVLGAPVWLFLGLLIAKAIGD
jgi:hypothetical protein